ncbi:ABC transporter ATP-binding protein [Amorphus orientalis]|uniref:Branched-chain amino acid transport system ATP-binding protein n=1 Tax=Amorphus orientalis TaxID=649198 RepID=A0AAE3VL18_9HYPH|nr:ABC transporter ATP-binding protein [Amorphus orientalis]MDQ0314454.1 branched-chain amino acid transport system ATP-binding protein [Amorphus orientalis]
MLEVQGLTKHFKGLTAVSGVSFSVAEGEISALIGPNGAGKTTTFNMIAGALVPSEGRISFDGRDITGLDPEVIAAAGISRTFQVVRPMVGMTVLENAMVGALAKGLDMAEAKADALAALDMVGLARRAGNEASSLTLPDRKMLEIARCLARKPRLLLLDEAMAGLRPSEADVLISVLRELNAQGLTILLIEHVMRVVMSLAGRVAVLHHGELIATGKPQEIVENPIVIESYLGRRKVEAGQ